MMVHLKYLYRRPPLLHGYHLAAVVPIHAVIVSCVAYPYALLLPKNPTCLIFITSTVPSGHCPSSIEDSTDCSCRTADIVACLEYARRTIVVLGVDVL